MGRETDLLRIQTVLGHFKVVELKSVCSYFSQVTWQTVIHELYSSKTPETKANIILLLLKRIANETRKSLHTIHIGLCAVDISLHSHRRLWYAYEMKNREDRTVNFEDLDQNISQGCRLNKIECDIKCLKSGEIIWFTLIEKKVKKNHLIERANPIFCAYIMESPYIFLHRGPKVSIIRSLLHALSYKSFKKLALSGHDILSLHTLLNRNKGATSTAFIPHYVEIEPREILGGIDATQHENRREFAKKCFDVDASLQAVTFVGNNTTWQGISHVPQAAGQLFQCSLTISSPNVFSTMKQLMEGNVIDPKTCSTYLKTLSRTGKNIIELGEENEESMNDQV